jgi:CheY-like chemotaxis protein
MEERCYTRDAEMATVLVCSTTSLDDELVDTLLWRDDITRHGTESAASALASAGLMKPDLLVVDRDLPHAERLIHGVRSNPATRRVSIAVVARSDFEPVEGTLLDAGANAVLRGPGGPDWDDRLARLLTVAVRREVRLPISVVVAARMAQGTDGHEAVTVNISASGMLVESDVELHLGETLDVRFQLPDTTIDVIGTVRVIRQAGQGRFGLEFVELEGDGADQIQSFVEHGVEIVC